MKKGFFVLGITVLVVAAALGVLYFIGTKQAQAPEAPAYMIPPEEMRNPEEIVVEGNRFTDTRQGYSGIIPEGWEIKKPTTIRQGTTLYDQVALTGMGEDGCKIDSGFINTSQSPTELIKETKETTIPYSTNPKIEEGEITIDGYSGVFLEIISIETGFSRAVYIPINDKIYGVAIFSSVDSYKNCLGPFDAFLANLRLLKI